MDGDGRDARIGRWRAEGRTDAWIAFQLGVSVRDLPIAGAERRAQRSGRSGRARHAVEPVATRRPAGTSSFLRKQIKSQRISENREAQSEDERHAMHLEQAAQALSQATPRRPAVSIWQNYGFTHNPYETTPIRPTSNDDARLLVGRDRELEILLTRLSSSALHPTVEGENGVGKTSLVAVAGHIGREDFRAGRSDQMLLPLKKRFALSEQSTPEEFAFEVLLEIAQGFVHEAQMLRDSGRAIPDLARIRRWINDPILGGGGAQASVLGVGGGGTKSASINSSTGYVKSGFVQQVRAWLDESFPTRESGGFVCVLDNLELLGTVATARKLMEEIRDTLFAQCGLRWVVCGAQGIVQGATASSRLDGYFSDPLAVRPLDHQYVPLVAQRRIEAAALSDSPYAPVEPGGLAFLFTTMQFNLRSAFRFAGDFAIWHHEQGFELLPSDERRIHLRRWLLQLAQLYTREAHAVNERSWSIFEDLAGEFGGECAPDDYEFFGLESADALRTHLRMLEQSNLVRSSVDDPDFRRRTVRVTPRGWLVYRYRTGRLK